MRVFSNQTPDESSPIQTGLFMIPGLLRPSDFNTLALRAISNCDEVIKLHNYIDVLGPHLYQ
jgi:hypothetical protein